VYLYLNVDYFYVVDFEHKTRSGTKRGTKRSLRVCLYTCMSLYNRNKIGGHFDFTRRKTRPLRYLISQSFQRLPSQPFLLPRSEDTRLRTGNKRQFAIVKDTEITLLAVNSPAGAAFDFAPSSRLRDLCKSGGARVQVRKKRGYKNGSKIHRVLRSRARARSVFLTVNQRVMHREG